MAQTGQAGLLWVTVIDLLGQQKFEEALQTAQEVQEKSQQIGIKATEASAATCRAVAQHCQRNSQVLDALQQLGATWGEAALLTTGGSAVQGPWAAVAQSLAQGGDPDVQRLSTELGLCWTETLEPRSARHLVSEIPAQKAELLKIAELKGSPQNQLRAAVALKELGRCEEALKSAAAAAEAFRDAGSSEGEATSLLCKSRALVGTDNMAALQAANHALKNFRELGHVIGQAVALHAIAKAQLAKRNTDDALNRAAESLRLLRSLGDRCREVLVLRTATEAALDMGAVRQALSFGLDALTTCRKLQDRFAEAKVLCLVARARSACGEAASSTAQEALAIYEELGLATLQLEALEAMAVACKGKQNPLEAATCAGSLAAKFQAAGMTKEQSECSYLLAKMFHDLQDSDAALAAAQEALATSDAGQAKVITLLSTIHLERKDFQEALQSSQRASELLGQPLMDEEKDMLLTCVSNQALALAQLGSFGEAQKFLEEKLRGFRRDKDKRAEGQVLFISAQLLQAKGTTEEALQRLSLATPALVESRDRRGEALAWQLSAKIHLEKNDLTKALPAAEMSAQAFRKVGDRRGRAQIAAVLAETQFSLCGVEKINDGNLLEARRAAQESVSLYHDLNERSVEMGYSLHCLANINLALHDWEAALQAAQEALELFRSLQLPLLETTALLLESGAYLGAQDFERSRQRAQEAKEIYTSAGALKGVDSVDQWLQNVERYQSGEQTLKTFHGFSMRRKFNAPVSQGDERQSFRAPRRLSMMNDIDLWMPDDSKVGFNVIISYQGLEHRAAGGGQPAGKAKVTASEMQKLQLHSCRMPQSKANSEGFQVFGGYPQLMLKFPDADMEYDVRWVHRRKSKSHSKGRRLQKAEEDKLLAK